MEKLRDKAINDILVELERFMLTRHSFDYEFNTPDFLVSLTFKDNPKYKFVIEQPSSTNNWKTIECPGIYFESEERFDLRDFPSCRSRIFQWEQRIIQEITFDVPHSSEIIQNLRTNLDKNANELNEPDLPFNEEDAVLWIDKINSAFKQIKVVKEKLKIQDSQINQLQKEIEKLTQNIRTIPKRTWLKTAGNRILHILESSSITITKAIAEGAVKGLLSDI